jgi:hypothetical protein
VQMDIPLQPKRSSSRAARLNKSEANVLRQVERNTWNPFERVDPKILEMLHRKHGQDAERTRRYFLLSQAEDAPV